MILCHLTQQSHLSNIRRVGLCKFFARGSRPGIWLCLPKAVPHFLRHLADVHQCEQECFALLFVNVEPKHLKRTGVKCAFRCVVDIEPDSILAYFHSPLIYNLARNGQLVS